MTTLADIKGAALRLPDTERFDLADKLLGRLPPPPDASEPDEILAEALRREAELESGQVKPFPGKRSGPECAVSAHEAGISTAASRVMKIATGPDDPVT